MRYRQLFKTASLFGLSSAYEILLKILRIKVISLMLGAEGVGLLTLLMSMQTNVSNTAGMGVSTSAVRDVSSSRTENDRSALSSVVSSLTLLSVIFSIIGGGVVFVFRDYIADTFLGGEVAESVIGWISLGVFFAVLSASMVSLLQGFREIKLQVLTRIIVSTIVAFITIISVWLLSSSGVVIYVVAAPLVLVLVSAYYLYRIGVVNYIKPKLISVSSVKSIFGIGLYIVTISTFQGWLTLILYAEITKKYGLDYLGLYQAAWSISFVYLGFVLQALVSDFYPRLAENKCKDDLKVLMDEQFHLVQVIVFPLLLFVLLFSHEVILLLYSSDFSEAVLLLKLMVVGAIFKVFSWPLGVLILAKGGRGDVLLSQLPWTVVFFGAALWLVSEQNELAYLGWVFVGAYMFHFCFMLLQSYKLFGYYPDIDNLRIFSYNLLFAIVILFGWLVSEWYGMVLGGVMLLLSISLSYKEFERMFGCEMFSYIKDRYLSKVNKCG